MPMRRNSGKIASAVSSVIEGLEQRRLLSTAHFVSIDTGTQGTWVGKYGSQGYAMPNIATSLPSYASLSVGGPAYTWQAPSGDSRASQTPDQTSRAATTWYGNYSIDLNFTGSSVHRVSFYAMDFDRLNRQEKLTVKDASTGVVLDSHDLSVFGQGSYATWDVSGHVTVELTLSAGLNAVISGIFFDAPNLPQPATGLTATSVDGGIKLDWTNSRLSGSVNLFRTDNDGNTVRVASSYPGQTFIDSTAVSGQTYSYSVQSINDRGGSVWSTASNEAVAGPGTSVSIGDPIQISPSTQDVSWFNNGQPLPAGKYRVTVVGGSMNYSVGQEGWRVNAWNEKGTGFQILQGNGSSTPTSTIAPGDEGEQSSAPEGASASRGLATTITQPAGQKIGIVFSGENEGNFDGDGPVYKLERISQVFNSLTVSEAGDSSHSVTNNGDAADASSLSIAENANHTAAINLSAALGGNTSSTSEQALWEIEGSGASTSRGSFAFGSSAVTLSTSGNNRSWIVNAGIDFNSNGVLDVSEIQRTVNVDLGFQVGISFAPDGVAAATGYVTDIGNSYRLGSSGYTFGWEDGASAAATQNTGSTFKRNEVSDKRKDSGIRTIANGNALNWEIAVPNGSYYLTLVAGDADVTSGTYKYTVEGASFLNGTASDGDGRWITAGGVVTVADGRLTISNGSGATNHALAFVEIQESNARQNASVAAPSAVTATAAGTTAVDIRWKDNANNEQSYLVERASNPAGTWTTVGMTSANGQLFTDTSASAGTTYAYRVTAVKSSGNSAATLGATVTTPSSSSQAPYNPGRTSWPTNTVVQAEDFDTGGDDVSYNDLVSGNAGGQYRSTDVDVGYNITNNRYFVGWTKAGEWTEYTMNVASAGTYILETRVASDGLGGKFKVSVGGTDKASGLQVPDTGGFTHYQTVSTSAFTLNQGSAQTLRLTATNDDPTNFFIGDFDWFKLVRVDGPTLTATAVSNSEVDLAWTSNADDVTGYKIYRRRTDSNTWSDPIFVAGNVTSYQDTGLTEGTSYTYRVDAIVQTSNGTTTESSPEASATTSGITPDQPPVITSPASADPDTVAGTTTVISVGATGAPGSSGPPTIIWTVGTPPGASPPVLTPVPGSTTGETTVTFTDPGTYTFTPVVSNSDNDGTTTGDPVTVTVVAIATSISVSPESVSVQPNDTQSFTATVKDQFGHDMDDAAIQWTADNGEVDSDGNYTAPSEEGDDTVTASFEGLSADADVQVTIPPDAPSDVSADAPNDNEANVTWTDNSDNETGFTIQESRDDATWSDAATTAPNATGWSITGLTADTDYYFRVQAFNGSQTSDWSDEAMATTAEHTQIGPYNTGIEDDRTPVPEGDTDPHWQQPVVISKDGSGNTVFPFQYWFANDSTSEWIAPQADQSSTHSDDGDTFTATQSFTLPDNLPAGVSIPARLSLDDWLGTVELNGVTQSLSLPQGGIYWNGWHSFTLSDGLVPGENTISISVPNGTDANESLNGHGLRVEFDTSHLQTVPTVSIAATDPDDESDSTPGEAWESPDNEQDKKLAFTVTRSGGDNSKPLTVDLHPAAGTATADDYQGLPSSVTIPANKNAKTFFVTAKKDDLVEGDETVTLCVKAAEDYRLGSYTATGTIHDAPRVDLDVDSNNDGAIDPDNSPNGKDDPIEDKPKKPGKFVDIDNTDADADGIPDFADGFQISGGNGSHTSSATGEHFTAVQVAIPNGVDLTIAKLSFDYNASDPSAVIIPGNETTAAEWDYKLPTGGGQLRLWLKDGTAIRDARGVADGGDYVTPGALIAASALGLSGSQRTVTLYLEGVDRNAANYWNTQAIKVSLAADGTNVISTDTVNVTCVYNPDGWRTVARKEAGFNLKTWNPLLGFGAVQNQFNLENIYYYYERLYKTDSTPTKLGKFQWPGFAKVAGGSVIYGLELMQDVSAYLTALSSVTSTVSGVSPAIVSLLTDIPTTASAAVLANVGAMQTTFMSMGYAIFNDLAWEYVAYREGGIKEIDRLGDKPNSVGLYDLPGPKAIATGTGKYKVDVLNAWHAIDSGTTAGIWGGNTIIANHEQNEVLAPFYVILRTSPFAKASMEIASALRAPFIGAPTFLGFAADRWVITDGLSLRMITNDSDRWSYIGGVLTSLWKGTTQLSRYNQIIAPLP